MFLKGIINPKNQFFMQNTNFVSLWSTRTLLDLFLKSYNKFSEEIVKIGRNKTVNFFTGISFIFTNNRVIRKYP